MPLDGRLGLPRPVVMGPGTPGLIGKLPNTNPSNSIELYITHIQDDGPLIKIYAQIDRMAAMFVEKLIISYEGHFEKLIGQPKSAHQLSIGLLCCAKYDDFKYYRARILNFTRPDKVSVVFVDYGNTAVIPLANIRLLANLGQDQALANIHDLSSEYILGGLVPRKSEWEKQTIEFMHHQLCYKELQCQIISEVCGKKLIRIFLEDVDFIKILVRSNLAYPLHIPPHEVLISGIYSKKVKPGQFNIPPPPIPRALPVESLSQPSQDTASYTPAPARFLSEMLIPGSEHLVYVSHVEDGPFTFAVQLRSVAERVLCKLMGELNSCKLQPISGPLIPGSVCLGRFSEDQSFCRAIVMNVFDDKCKLYYADYGNSEILPYSEIFEVPPQYVGLKVMALRFTLANIRGQVLSDEVKAFFKQLVTDKQVVIKVTPPEASPLKQYCEMFIEGRNVKQMLVEKAMAEQPLSFSKQHTPVKGTQEKVIVTYVESTNRFFVQLDCNKEALSTVMSCVAGNCQTGAPLLPKSKLRPGVTCCALYPSDQNWYRAEILSVKDDTVMVFFVDYGNQDNVPVSSLREIHRDLVTKVRKQALQCCLNGYQNTEPDQSLSILFEELALENEFTMIVVDVTSNQIPVVNLYDSRQTSITSQLVIPSNVSPTPAKAAVIQADDEWDESAVSPQPDTKSDFDSRRYNAVKTKSPSRMERSCYKKGPLKEQGAYKRQRGNDGFKKSFGDESRNKPWRSRENGEEREEKSSGSWRNKDDSKTSWRNKENDDKSNKWGPDKDENCGTRFDRGARFGKDNEEGRFKRDDNQNSSSRTRKFDKDDDNEGRKFGRTRDDDNEGRQFGRTRGDDNERRKFGRTRDDENEGRKFGRTRDDENEGRKFGRTRDDENEGRKFGRTRDDENEGRKFGRTRDDENEGSKFGRTRDDENEGRKFGRTRDGERGGGDHGGRFDKGDSFKPKWGDGGAGGDFRRNKFEGGGFKRNDDRDSFKKPFDRGDGGRTSTWAGNKFSSRVDSKAIPQSSVQVGSTEVVEIVFSVSPSEFYVQLSSDCDKLTTLMADIATSFEADSGESLDNPKKGQFCIAKYSEDETWYRGRIESAETDSADVVFVDYGNHEQVSNENIKKISATLTSLPMQAVKCGLYGCEGETWSEEDIVNFTTRCEGKKLKAEFLEKVFVTDSFKVVLTDEESLSIINCEARYSVPKEQIDEALIKMNQRELREFPIQLGTTIKVQMSWFISPSHFYVQPMDYDAEFRAMVEQMQTVAKKGSPKPTTLLKVGDPIIARFKEDKVLYRARMKTDGLDPIVTYVDYGNCAKVETGMTWELEPQYSTLPIQGICCALSGIVPSEEAWPKSGDSDLDSYFMADEFNCTFIKKLDGENNSYAVQLLNGEKNIADQLIAGGLAVEGSVSAVQDVDDDVYGTVELELLVGQIFSVVVTHVEHAGLFYMYLQPAQANLLLQEINGLSEDQERLPANQVLIGSLCLAKNEDKFCRCRILSSEVPEVQFIDYGHSKTLTLEEMYILPEGKLSKHTPLATDCALFLTEPLTQELETQFKNTPKLKPYIAYINGVQNQKLQVTLYEKDGNLTPYQQDGLSSPPAVDPICPLPILRSHQKVTISHAGEDSIYLHRSEFIDVITELLGSLYDFYNEKEYEEQDWKVGMYCAAKSSVDEQWYRAKIMAMESEVTVQYIDYGNYEVLPSTSLRILDASYYDQHELAIKVSFHVQWLVPVETLLDLTEGKVYNAVILRNSESHWLTELMSQEGVSLTNSLVELGYATVLEDSPFKRVVEGGRFVEGSELSVSVSHIDSPSQIWLHIVSDIEVVEELQDRLQIVANKLKPLIRPQGIFAAKWFDMWYRAVHIEDNIVRFIDYGNSDQVDLSDLKELTSDFSEPAEGYAVKCSLYVEPKERKWNDDSRLKLEELLIDSEVIAHILTVNESSVVADLLIGDKNVAEVLVEEGLANPLHNHISVFVSHINSPSDFYIHVEGSETELEEIAEFMLSAENFEELKDIDDNLDNLIAAKYSVDELWYRAKVITKVEDKVTVLFVDYGNSTDATEFKILPLDISAKPYVAKHCSLKLPPGVKQWSEEGLAIFQELAAGGTNVFRMVKQVEGEPIVVVLLTNEGESFADLLTRNETEVNKENTQACWTSVYVSHANSPKDFYIQLETCSADLDKITERMSDIDSLVVINNPAEWIGKIVAGQSSADELWYRAKVLEYNDSGIKVFFVDYGNSEVVLEVRELPEDLAQSTILAKHCVLRLPKETSDWSAKASNKFIELVSDISVLFEMCVLVAGESNIVSLRLEGKIIEDVLAELCEEQIGCVIKESTTDETTPKESSIDFFSVFVSHINSPSDFYVQKEGCESSLQEISNSLIDAEQFEDLNLEDKEKLIGEVVATQYQLDSLWYRSKILEFIDSEVKVLFVDFGNVANVTKLKVLPQDLKDRENTARHCSLITSKDIDSWSESACRKFIELTGEGTVLLELRIIHSCGTTDVVDLYTEGQSVVEILTKLCISNINSSVMATILLDSVQSERDLQRDQIVLEVEQITEDIINKAADRVAEKYVKLEAETLVGIIKDYEGRKSDGLVNNELETNLTKTLESANTPIGNNINEHIKDISVDNKEITSFDSNRKEVKTSNDRLSRYNIDEHIVPGCVSQSTEVDNNETECKEVLQNKDQANITDESNKENTTCVEANNTDPVKSDNILEEEEYQDNPTLKIDLPDVQIIHQSDSESPKTPSRLNIDEHIVPGCVSQSTEVDNNETECKEVLQNKDQANITDESNKENTTCVEANNTDPVKSDNILEEEEYQDNPTLKIDLPDVQIIHQSDSESPKTPSRLNIDEHIVPGCVSQSTEVDNNETECKEVLQNKDQANITDESNKENTTCVEANNTDPVKSDNILEEEEYQDNPTLKIDLPDVQIIHESDSDTPKTPSRLNIDEHIVPGCMSQSTEVDNNKTKYEELVQNIDHAELTHESNKDNTTCAEANVSDPPKNVNISEEEIHQHNPILKIDLPVVEEINQSDSETPKTPSRLNIDEHIVPGCITQVPDRSPSDK